MAYPLEEMLVVGAASRALFDLSESDEIFRESGEGAYRECQEARLEEGLEPGLAFPLILSVDVGHPMSVDADNLTTSGRRQGERPWR